MIGKIFTFIFGFLVGTAFGVPIIIWIFNNIQWRLI